jgi:hypothetical protein
MEARDKWIYCGWVVLIFISFAYAKTHMDPRASAASESCTWMYEKAQQYAELADKHFDYSFRYYQTPAEVSRTFTELYRACVEVRKGAE